MRGIEGDACLNRLIGGVGDEVDICGGKFAAYKAYDFFRVLVRAGQFEIGIFNAVESFFEFGGAGDKHDAFFEFGDLWR